MKSDFSNSDVFWTLIGVVLGSVFSLIFNELSQYFRYRGERRRIVNKVLYSLLNIRFELSKITQNSNSKDALSMMENIWGEEIPEHLRTQLESNISNASSELIESSVFDNLQEIGIEFKSVLLAFSEIDPVGAYRLSDESKYLLNLEGLKNYLASVKGKFSESETPVDYNEFQLCIKNKVIKESVISLKKEIEILSKKTKKYTRDEVSSLLKKQDNPIIELNEFDECIQLMFKDIPL